MDTFDFIPADTLFCRDGRPLAAGSSFGRGAHLPLPPLLHAAVRTALLRLADCTPRGKIECGSPRPGSKTGMDKKPIGTAAFQWLSLRGPFPVKQESVFVPIPRDLVSGSIATNSLGYLWLRPNANHNNLPPFLRYIGASGSRPSKEELPGWVDFDFLKSYLTGTTPLPYPPNPELWTSEYRIGVALNGETHTAADGQLYAAEHLRLREGVRLRFSVSSPSDHKSRRDEERGKTVKDLHGAILQLGGERRFGQIAQSKSDLALPSVAINGTRVKWVLLTPALFSHGWRPGWIGNDGAVKLRVVNKEARRDFRRQRRNEGWHYDESKDTAEVIRSSLVAAVTGKPFPVSGWDPLHSDVSAPDRNVVATGGGKPTLLAVPAGSVYYFEADSEEEAIKLAAALRERCRSDFFGEKGLGLGVCGTWQHQLRTFADVRSHDNSQTTN